MKKINVTVQGHSPRTYPSGIPASDIIQDIDPHLSQNAFAVKVNGELRDWNRHLDIDAEMEIIKSDSEEGHQILLHSTAHLMAHVVKELFPNTQISIGPAIENIVTWHERDLTQSSPERFLIPEACIIVDYLLLLMSKVLNNLHVPGHSLDLYELPF